MKKFLIAAMMIVSISSILGKSYEKTIDNPLKLQEFFEKKAKRKITNDDLKKIREEAQYVVNNYTEEDLLIDEVELELGSFQTSQELKEKARQIKVLAEIINFEATVKASCLLAEADKDLSHVVTGDDYCNAYRYAFMAEVYAQLQNKADQEKLK